MMVPVWCLHSPVAAAVEVVQVPVQLPIQKLPNQHQEDQNVGTVGNLAIFELTVLYQTEDKQVKIKTYLVINQGNMELPTCWSVTPVLH